MDAHPTKAQQSVENKSVDANAQNSSAPPITTVVIHQKYSLDVSEYDLILEPSSLGETLEDAIEKTSRTLIGWRKVGRKKEHRRGVKKKKHRRRRGVDNARVKDGIDDGTDEADGARVRGGDSGGVFSSYLKAWTTKIRSAAAALATFLPGTGCTPEGTFSPEGTFGLMVDMLATGETCRTTTTTTKADRSNEPLAAQPRGRRARRQEQLLQQLRQMFAVADEHLVRQLQQRLASCQSKDAGAVAGGIGPAGSSDSGSSDGDICDRYSNFDLLGYREVSEYFRGVEEQGFPPRKVNTRSAQDGIMGVCSFNKPG